MTPPKPWLRFSLMSFLMWIASIAFVLAAFSRGKHLLGSGAGLLYAVAASMIALLMLRAMNKRPIPKLRLALLALIAIPACFVFAFPAHFNSDIQAFVEKQAIDRNIRREMHAVFAEDAAFSNLILATTQLKIVNVDIRGTVPTKSDLARVQKLVYSRCESVKYCFVRWRVRVRSEAKTYVAKNDGEFIAE